MDDEFKSFCLGLSPNFGDQFAMQQYYNSLPAEVLKDIALRHYEHEQKNGKITFPYKQ